MDNLKENSYLLSTPSPVYLALINGFLSAIVQSYDANVAMEDVLLRNDVLFKCNIPSHISDFITVIGWVDSEGSSHTAAQNAIGKLGQTTVRVKV